MSRKSKTKVLFVLPNLYGGGAQRVMLTLLRHLDRRQFELHLAVVVGENLSRAGIPDDVSTTYLNCARVGHSFWPLLRLVRRLRPDVAFSTLGHLNLALIITRPFFPGTTRLIVREASIVTETIRRLKRPGLWAWLYRTFYRRADLIICQSNYMLNDLAENFSVPRDRMARIYNPVDIDAALARAGEGANPFATEGEGPHLLAAGRLSWEKGFDRLLRSIPDLLKIKPGARLWIAGSGPLEGRLKALRDRLNLTGVVRFVGHQDNIYRWLKHADLFVLTSYYEGLPNVLLEALACGCPVLVTEHPGGTREIMELTGLSRRVVPELTWREEWFAGEDSLVSERLLAVFGIPVVLENYSKYLSG